MPRLDEQLDDDVGMGHSKVFVLAPKPAWMLVRWQEVGLRWLSSVGREPERELP